LLNYKLPNYKKCYITRPEINWPKIYISAGDRPADERDKIIGHTKSIKSCILSAQNASAFIVPRELPSILSIVYSNIPPIKKGRMLWIYLPKLKPLFK